MKNIIALLCSLVCIASIQAQENREAVKRYADSLSRQPVSRVRGADSVVRSKFQTMKPSVATLDKDSVLRSLKERGEEKVGNFQEQAKSAVSLSNAKEKVNAASSFQKLKGLRSDLASKLSKIPSIRSTPEYKATLSNQSMLFQDSGPGQSEGLLMNIFSGSVQGHIGKIPVAFNFAKGYNSQSEFDPMSNNLFKLNFNRNQFDHFLKSDLDRYKAYREKNLGGSNLPQYTSTSIKNKIRSVAGNKISVQEQALDNYLKDPEHVNELLKTDDALLKQKLKGIMSAKLDSAKKDRKAGLQQEKLSDKKLNESIDSTIAVLRSVKKGLKEHGLNVQAAEVLQKYQEYKGNQDDLDEEVFDYLNKAHKPSRIEGLFSRVKSFNTGSIGSSIPGSSFNRELFIQGFDLALASRKGPVQIGFGSQKDIGRLKDQEFENSSFTAPKYISFLSLPTNKSMFGNGKISWIALFNKQESSSVSSINYLQRTSMAFTVSQNVSLNKWGKLNVDISKSGSQFRNTLSPYNDQVLIDKSYISNYFSNDFSETLSFGFNHSVDVKRIGLSNTFYLNYSGLGYQNPGAMGMMNMKMRYGGNLKKRFFSNKMAVALRTDFKNTPVSYTSDAQWKNHQVQLDTRYNFSRNLNLSLKYMENGMDKSGTVRSNVYTSRKLQISSNATYKLGKHYSFTNINVSNQRFNNNPQINSSSFPSGLVPVIPVEAKSNLLMLNYTQSIVFNDFTLNGSLFGNKELSSNKLIGDMINSEAGAQYMIAKKLNLNTGITYLSNGSLVKQIGFKQGMQFQVDSQFDLGIYVDQRKNLIQSANPYLYTASRGEFSIRYHFNNN